MEVVDIELAESFDLDRDVIVGKIIELYFMFAPVVLGLPVFGEAFDVCKRSTVIPSGLISAVRSRCVG